MCGRIEGAGSGVLGCPLHRKNVRKQGLARLREELEVEHKEISDVL
jgi:hypothetical protein